MKYNPITFQPGVPSGQIHCCLGHEQWSKRGNEFGWPIVIRDDNAEQYRSCYQQGIDERPEFWTGVGWRQLYGDWKLDRQRYQFATGFGGGNELIYEWTSKGYRQVDAYSFWASPAIFSTVHTSDIGGVLECLTTAEYPYYYCRMYGFNAPRGVSMRVIADIIDAENYKYVEYIRHHDSYDINYANTDINSSLVRLGEMKDGKDTIRGSASVAYTYPHTYSIGIVIKEDAFFAVHGDGFAPGAWFGHPTPSSSLRHGIAVGPQSKANPEDIPPEEGVRFRFGDYQVWKEYDHPLKDSRGKDVVPKPVCTWYNAPWDAVPGTREEDDGLGTRTIMQIVRRTFGWPYFNTCHWIRGGVHGSLMRFTGTLPSASNAVNFPEEFPNHNRNNIRAWWLGDVRHKGPDPQGNEEDQYDICGVFGATEGQENYLFTAVYHTDLFAGHWTIRETLPLGKDVLVGNLTGELDLTSIHDWNDL